MSDFNNTYSFSDRHIGPDNQEVKEMLQAVGADSMEQLIGETIPASIRIKQGLDLPGALSETEFQKHIKKIAGKNSVFKSYIGYGYYDTITPAVIKRNILENPGWYTAYTPYQAEIAQGRLEALANFQTMVMELTGMDLANASLLDEGTAAGEAMSMFFSLRKGAKKKANVFVVDKDIYPQTLAVLQTRAEPLGIELQITELQDDMEFDDKVFGMFFQYPNSRGQIRDHGSLVKKAKDNDLMVAVAADLLSLTLLTPPGEWGVDAVVGSAQRFGVPMGYGGPHAAFFATLESYKRQIPGRIIGVSVDKYGNKAYRMALQTREQHIKRERATSNICTAQVLLAVMASMYAVYHGAEGLKAIALNIHRKTAWLAKHLNSLGYSISNSLFFDTLFIPVSGQKKSEIKVKSAEQEININIFPAEGIQVSIDEATSYQDLKDLLQVFAAVEGKSIEPEQLKAIDMDLPDGLKRKSSYLTHPVFNTNHSEHELLRYMKKLENKDLSLVHSMISLGSCTMKLNATSEMEPITWPEFAGLHPFAPLDQARGYHEMNQRLVDWLCEITGFADVSLQPNSGAQGEYTGLMTIRSYLMAKGEGHRNIVLIPTSAHGTNPASAVMSGMNVVLVKCDEKGNVDLDDIREKAEKHSDNLAALMVTYPSTHGVFEENIREICDLVHEHGGQVYMDGANMNAQVGLTSPALIGADVCHLNLHKTFCIPHGGGGPGMGPIGVVDHLSPFLPDHTLINLEKKGHSVSSAPYGSAGILPISYAYLLMMGGEGLTKATEVAILSANYIKEKLNDHFPALYTGSKGRNAHEFIIDCREFKKAGVEVEDIAKRLMDYGYHSPTVSFPVPGTMMIEPTESETKGELDRFCEAMISIREEIREIEAGIYDEDNNVLKNAPHTMRLATADSWEFPYSREKAVFPLPFVRESKFWPSVSRIDSAYGDRNLFCACIPVEEYQGEEKEGALAD